MLLLLVAFGLLACGDDDGAESDAAVGDGGEAFDAGPEADAGERDGGSSADGGSDSDGGGADAGPVTLTLPPANGSLDYQLGEAYEPPSGVVVVSRDRNATPAPGLYNICYVNGFQTQPDERGFWTDDHPDLLLRDGSGDVVIDPDWDEIILDITTPEKRAALADIVGGWIDGCATAGFDAIEIDNLDTYSRSGDRVSQNDAVAFMRLLSDRAHAAGLPIAQKNSTEVLARREEMGTDFAVAEECNRYSECGEYTDVYGDQVYVIEYRMADFTRGCADFPELSIVLRDRDLVGPTSGRYVYDGC
ncbi:MAG: endo alpha-1,4 polygalactosaminidase [Sandaracinus sp.]|nr:endo alpha-1,4 polygalactosaminidase [Sandaracinus sp.]